MIKYAFFGSSKMSTYVLDELLNAGFKPDLVVTTPDKPAGRGLELKPNELKSFAVEKGLHVIDDQSVVGSRQSAEGEFDVFVVASYGKILPASIIFAPKHKTLNVHPSLLPQYRGASPLQASILNDTKRTGVTIMRLDEKMDHGPIVAQQVIDIKDWPPYEQFEEMMAREGGRLLASLLPDWVEGKIPEKEQDHSQATFTKKIAKEEALIDLAADPYENFRKVQAYHQWPQAYFIARRKEKGERRKEETQKEIRVKIINASFEDGRLSISEVLPEGSRCMTWKDFEQGYSQNPQSD